MIIKKVNGAKVPLPYTGPTFTVYKEGDYIVFDDPRFNVAFDGRKMLKIRVCLAIHYGLCHLQDDHVSYYPFEDYLSEDSSCDFYI